MLRNLRGQLGQWIYGSLLLPPNPNSADAKVFDGDYGNGFLYEELFSGNGLDLKAALKICSNSFGEVLDAGGGKGRISEALAESGTRVTLVDASEYMIQSARQKRERLLPASQERWTIVKDDLSTFSLNKKFQIAFAINNIFEHFESVEQTKKTLWNVARHLSPTGFLYLDVHHVPSLEKDPKWKTGKWRYNFDKRIRGKRYRVWQRTLPGENEKKVICEQAFSTSRKDFLFSRQVIQTLKVEEWIEVFRLAGFKVYNIWGNWAMDPVSNQLPKIVVKLGLL